jgi:hypothetical protein
VRCLAWPIRGGFVCYKRHGGKAPQVREAARLRLERERAEQAVATFGLPREIDPFDALKEELARTAGHVAWLQEIIAEMEPVDLVWGETSEEASATIGTGTGAKGDDSMSNTSSSRSEAGLTTWLKIYQDERRHYVTVAATAIKCGIAEREVKLLEQQGKMIADIFRAFINDPELAVEPEVRQTMLVVASKHLRAVA